MPMGKAAKSYKRLQRFMSCVVCEILVKAQVLYSVNNLWSISAVGSCACLI